MSSSNNLYVIGASLIGIIGAVSVILFQHFKQEKRSRTLTQNLMRMDAQISVMRAELEQIRISQRLKKRELSQSRRSLREASSSKAQIRSPVSADEITSPSDVDTSDLEFFDISDDEEFEEATVSLNLPLRMAMQDVDRRLLNSNIEVIEETLTILEDLCKEYPENPDLWYRLAKCCHRAAMRSVTPSSKRDNITRGVLACLRALEYNNDNAEYHKLYAILVGLRCDFEPTKQRIADGYLFKEHIDIAITLSPNDPTLHHMLGRFKFEVASLKWFERKMATALFGQPPSSTYEEALECFLKAENLSANEWKENKMYVGKCYISLGDIRRGVDCLQQAQNMYSGSQMEEHALDHEINSLLHKYRVPNK